MRFAQSRVLLGFAALAVALAFSGTPASAASKCASAKQKCVGKKQACKLGCHAKDEGGPDAVALAACLTKCEDKFDGGADPLKGCFEKLENKLPNDCTTNNDTAALEAKVDAFVLDVVQELDPGFPPSTLSKCSAAKKKCVGKKASCKLGCEAKNAAKPDAVKLAACLGKCEDKFDGGVDPLKGCFEKLENKLPNDCLTNNDTVALEAKVDAFVADVVSELPSSGGATCGNGANDPGEECDPSTPPASWSVCGPTFTCSGTCNCACPTKVHFAGDAADPATILDSGWTGIAHRAPVISNGDVTINISCVATERPCGTCNVSGPIANTGNQLRNQRCSGDTSVQCTSAPNGVTGCGGPLGLCQFFFGAPLPLVAGGVGTCVENIFNGSVSGTANVETGQAVTTANLTSRVHAAVISTDTPCPVCNGADTPNDGLLGGTCNGGPRNGMACDKNGTVPGRPDFGSTSLDCPPPASTIAVLPIDLSNSTGTVSKNVTSGSPNCSGAGLPAGTKCVCDTCNNANAEPCDANSDCPISGGNPGICGGRRCIGGTNIGAPCTVASQCPGGGACARPGEPTKPNGCVDNTTTLMVNGSLCVDTAPVGDNEGECPEGPPTGVCSVSSGHPQRSCTSANDCCNDAPACVTDPPTPGECLIANRLCFLDNGLGGAITASGMADPPTNDVSDPTLAAVFCIGPTSAPAVNIAAGLPGPGRTTIKGTATGLP